MLKCLVVSLLLPNLYLIKDSDMKHFKKVISTNIYPDYADIINRFVGMVLVRDHYKQLVIAAFQTIGS